MANDYVDDNCVGDGFVDGYYPEHLFVESIVRAVAYSYKVDMDAPNFIDKAARIFTVSSETPELATVTANANVDISTKYRESGDTSEEHLGGSASVGGYYGCFYGSASMSLDSTSSENTRTVRLDALAKASKYKLSAQGEFRNFPERYLTEDFKEAVKAFDYEKIEQKMGHFYALEMTLGGCIQKSYIMDAVEGDSSSSVTGELSATYGAGVWGVTGSASVTKETSRGQHRVDMKEEWRAMGGNTMMWLGQDFSQDDGNTMTELTKKWAATIHDDNLFSFDLELIPLWEMVEAVDAEKGKGYKDFLLKKWERDPNQMSAKYRFTSDSPGGSLKNVALKRSTVYQSSIGWGGERLRAVDGNTDGNYYNGGVTHTDVAKDGGNCWWRCELGGWYKIRKVKIYNRTDGWDTRLSSAEVYLGRKQVGGVIHVPGKVSYKWNCGDYCADEITVELHTGNHLSLAQVEVWSTGEKGTELKNVSKGKPCFQSSISCGGDPNRAVNGTAINIYDEGNVTHTDCSGSKDAWWYVDLGARYRVYEINIMNRHECAERLDKAQVMLDKTVVHTIEHVPGKRWYHIPIPNRQVTSRVTVALKTGQILSLCEVQVMSDGIPA